MAAAKIWPHASVTAVDIDPVSVATTRENAAANGVAKRVRAIAGNGYAVLADEAPYGYDLILSNILARPLCKMAPSLDRHLRPGGTVSGPSMFALPDVSVYLAVLAMIPVVYKRITGRQTDTATD